MRTPQDRTQLREEAIALRLAGKSVRDIPCQKRGHYVESENRREGLRRYFNALAAEHTAEVEAAAAEIGELYRRIEGWATGTMAAT